jgi:hypothetical protein
MDFLLQVFDHSAQTQDAENGCFKKTKKILVSEPLILTKLKFKDNFTRQAEKILKKTSNLRSWRYAFMVDAKTSLACVPPRITTPM